MRADDRQCAAWLEAWTAAAVTVERGRRPPLDLASFPVSILETMCPDSLKTALLEGDSSLPTRFLYVWPGPQDYRALAALDPVHDDEVLDRLRRLSTLARTPDDPCELRVDDRGREGARRRADRSSRRAAERRRTGGRMAGQGQALHRPAWRECWSFWDSIGGHAAVGPARSELSRSKRRPRSGGLLLAACTRGVRRRRALGPQATRAPRRALAARHAAATVSREEIRRRALGQSRDGRRNASTCSQRLHYLGYVQPDLAYRDKPGRPSTRWLVNPALAEAENR